MYGLSALITADGRPNVKIAAMESGSGLLLSGEEDPTYVQILSEAGTPKLKLSDKNGREQLLTP